MRAGVCCAGEVNKETVNKRLGNIGGLASRAPPREIQTGLQNGQLTSIGRTFANIPKIAD